ncbi:MAG: flavodoxin [bacterium]|nr:flavodoxin [bacterium]
MKVLVSYSSRTGNTEKVARAIYKALPAGADIYPVESAPSPESYDLVVIGFWFRRGTADSKTLDYLPAVNNKKVALFATLGAYPDSDHALVGMDRVIELLETDEEAVTGTKNIIIDSFICQGKVNPGVLGKHPMTPEREKRLNEAAKHPDKTDLANAGKFIKKVVREVKNL